MYKRAVRSVELYDSFRQSFKRSVLRRDISCLPSVVQTSHTIHREPFVSYGLIFSYDDVRILIGIRTSAKNNQYIKTCLSSNNSD